MNTPETKPFHETIIVAIRRSANLQNSQIFDLFELIKETTIPANHNAIIATIDEYFNFPGANKWAFDIRLVKENLLLQKQAAEAKKNASFDPETIKANRLAIVDKINELHLLCGKFDGQTFEDSFMIALRKELRELYELTKKH